MGQTLRRCPGCHDWYPVQDGDCPRCGQPAARFNPFLKRAKLNGQLYGQAEHALHEKAYAAAGRLLDG